MKKIFFFALFFFVFLALGGLQKTHAADFNDPHDLQAVTSCSPSSTIDFSWVFVPTSDNSINYSQYFWKTGDQAETKISYAFGQATYHAIVNSLPNNTTYSWYVRVHQEGICIGKCDAKISGTDTISKTCDQTLPTCVYTYSDWSSCVNGQQTRTVLTKQPNPCTGDPVVTQNCTAPHDVYDCTHRSPDCPTSTYPTANCKTWPFSYLGSCDSANYCVMHNTGGSDETKWTTSCAWKSGTTPPADYVPPPDETTVNYTPVPPPCNDGTNHSSNCVSVVTALGTVPTDPKDFVPWVLGFILSLAGGILIIILILAGYRLMTSQGDPEKIKDSRERVTSALIGLLFIIFSFVFYRFITTNILNLPGFK